MISHHPIPGNMKHRYGEYDSETHEVAEIDSPEQRFIILHSIVQVLTGGVDSRQVFRVDETQNMVHDLQRKLCKEDHCVYDGLMRHSRVVLVRGCAWSHQES